MQTDALVILNIYLSFATVNMALLKKTQYLIKILTFIKCIIIKQKSAKGWILNARYHTNAITEEKPVVTRYQNLKLFRTQQFHIL